MLIEQGSQKLREFTEASYQEKHTKVTDGYGIYQVWGTAMRW